MPRHDFVLTEQQVCSMPVELLGLEILRDVELLLRNRTPAMPVANESNYPPYGSSCD
jgi:hypothetical protein